MQARRHGAAEIFGWHCDGGPRAARPRAGHIYAEKLVAAMLQKWGATRKESRVGLMSDFVLRCRGILTGENGVLRLFGKGSIPRWMSGGIHPLTPEEALSGGGSWRPGSTPESSRRDRTGTGTGSETGIGTGMCRCLWTDCSMLCKLVYWPVDASILQHTRSSP